MIFGQYASHLKKSIVVGVVILVVRSLPVHLVPVTGHAQLMEVVQGGGVQGVSINQTHQVLFVVLPVHKQEVKEEVCSALTKGKFGLG